MTTTTLNSRAARRIDPTRIKARRPESRRPEVRRIDNILPHITPQVALFTPDNANHSMLTVEEAGDKLTGTYEVLLPGTGERILFADTLQEVVYLLSSAFNSSAQEEAGFEYQLKKAAAREELRPNAYGIRFHETRNGAPWIAKVRGLQTRPAPQFKEGDLVYLDTTAEEVANHRTSAKSIKVGKVYLVNHPNPAKHYLYYVGGNYIRQERMTLAPVQK